MLLSRVDSVCVLEAHLRVFERVVSFLERIHSVGEPNNGKTLAPHRLTDSSRLTASPSTSQLPTTRNLTKERNIPLTTRIMEFEGYGMAANVSHAHAAPHAPRDSNTSQIVTSHPNLHSTRSLPLLTVLKKTATTLLILKQLFGQPPSSLSRNFSMNRLLELLNILPHPIFTLRQVFYGCKPMLVRTANTLYMDPPSSPQAPLDAPIDEVDIDADIRDGEGSGLEHEELPADAPSPANQAQSRTAPPSYIYQRVSEMCRDSRIIREHLLLDAEGKALFAVRMMTSGSLDAMDAFQREVGLPFHVPNLVTTRTIDELSARLSAFLHSSTSGLQLQNAISIVAIEKEGVFDQILRRLDAQEANARELGNPPRPTAAPSALPGSKFPQSSQDPGVNFLSSNTPRDAFDSIVMDPLNLPTTSLLSPGSYQDAPFKIWFLVCLKGFPCHNSRKLLRLLHQFHTATCVNSFEPTPRHTGPTPSNIDTSRAVFQKVNYGLFAWNDLRPRRAIHSLRAPPILCLVDCNPSGILIMQSLKRSPTMIQGDEEAAMLFPIAWIGLLPSQLAFWSPGSLHLQNLSTRDVVLLKSILECEREPSMKVELQAMSETRVKAELQCLYGLKRA